jgi:hypothetical protein
MYAANVQREKKMLDVGGRRKIKKDLNGHTYKNQKGRSQPGHWGAPSGQKETDRLEFPFLPPAPDYPVYTFMEVYSRPSILISHQVQSWKEEEEEEEAPAWMTI